MEESNRTLPWKVRKEHSESHLERSQKQVGRPRRVLAWKQIRKKTENTRKEVGWLKFVHDIDK